ncbi:Transcription regulator [Hirschfeldia incana]|nr:Transcription regulator [Hirschfeldia incana]
MVTVDTLEKGFMIKIMSGKNEPGMLVCVLEAFEDLGLEVVEARVSCTDSFSLHAIGISNNDDAECMDAEAVKQAVSVAVRTWSDSHDPRGGRISDSTGKGT